jgi:plasmid stabilization system protein ParE
MKIYFSRAFEEDLLEITDYIANKLQNKQAAGNLVKDIFAGIDLLKTDPELGTPLSSVFPYMFNNEYRKLVVRNYVVIYKLESDIVVKRVFYGRRDYIAFLSLLDNN